MSTGVQWAECKREIDSVEAYPTHGHPPAKLLPHKDRLRWLVVKEPDLNPIENALVQPKTIIRSAAEDIERKAQSGKFRWL